MKVAWDGTGVACEVWIVRNDGANSSQSPCGVSAAAGLPLSLTSSVGPVEWGAECNVIEGLTCRLGAPSEDGYLSAIWMWTPPEGHYALEILNYGGREGIVRSDVDGLYGYHQGVLSPYPLRCGLDATPGAVVFGLQCSQAFPAGTTVTLTALPVDGFEFAGWSGGGCSGTGACEVVLDRSYKVTPSFTPVAQGPPPPTTTRPEPGTGTLDANHEL
jgi:hypothetical protein